MVLSVVNKRVPDSFSAITTLQIAIIIILSLLKAAQGENRGNENMGLCPDGANVDLSNVKQNESGFITHDGLFFPRDLVTIEDKVVRGCICDVKPCLPFCPIPEDPTSNETTSVSEVIVDHPAIPKIYHANLTIEGEDEAPSLEKRFHYVYSHSCDWDDTFLLHPKKYEFYLLGNGSLLLRGLNTSEILRFKSYCFDYDGNDYDMYHPFVCSPSSEKRITAESEIAEEEKDREIDDLRMVTYITLLVSVPFLVATVIVYSIVPALRNIHGTILRCYLCCLIISSIILGVQRISKTDLHPNNVCIFFGFFNYSSYITSFFWLNVMCFDMWWKFGGFGTFRISSARNDRKKFIGYSIYVSLSTSLLTIISVIMEYSPGIPESMIRPEFSSGCWFGTNTSATFYLYGPFGVLIACNILMFVWISLKLYIRNRDTDRDLNNRESQRHNDNKQWFHLFLRLFVVMGITWTAEIISWYWGDGRNYNRYLFTLDEVNALQGVSIFVILVCRRNVWRALKKYYYMKKHGEFTSRMNDFTSTPSNSQSAQSAAGLPRIGANGEITSTESISSFSNFTNSSLVTVGSLDQSIDDNHRKSSNSDESPV